MMMMLVVVVVVIHLKRRLCHYQLKLIVLFTAFCFTLSPVCCP